MSKETYIIRTHFECDAYYPKHLVESNAVMRSTLEEAQEWIDDKVKKYRDSFSVAQEINLKEDKK